MTYSLIKIEAFEVFYFNMLRAKRQRPINRLADKRSHLAKKTDGSRQDNSGVLPSVHHGYQTAR